MPDDVRGLRFGSRGGLHARGRGLRVPPLLPGFSRREPEERATPAGQPCIWRPRRPAALDGACPPARPPPALPGWPQAVPVTSPSRSRKIRSGESQLISRCPKRARAGGPVRLGGSALRQTQTKGGRRRGHPRCSGRGGVWGPPHPGGAAALYVRPRCPPGSQGRQRYGPRKRPLPSRLGPSLHFLTLARPRSWPGPQKCGHPREPEPAGTRKGFPSPAPAGPAVEFAAPPSPGPPDREPGPGPPAGQTARESGGRRECLAAEKEEKARLLAGRLT